MRPGRVHITGASGAGVTTLGRSLAQLYAVPHFDTDDFYWMPTPVAFSQKRPTAERVALLETMLGARPAFLLSGSITGWGDPLIPLIDVVVLVRTSQALRMDRLTKREIRRYGPDVLRDENSQYVATQDFLSWAERYDDPTFAGRSLASHRAWLSRLGCPVVEVDGSRPIERLSAQVAQALDGLGMGG